MTQYCAVCYFELPVGSNSIASTDIGLTTDIYGRGCNYPPAPPPCDLDRPLSKADLESAARSPHVAVSEVPTKWIFRFEALQKSAGRGCKTYGKIHEIITALSPDVFEFEVETDKRPTFSWELWVGTFLFALAYEETPRLTKYYKLFFRDTDYESRLPPGKILKTVSFTNQ
jgi:hypothetical protein